MVGSLLQAAAVPQATAADGSKGRPALPSAEKTVPGASLGRDESQPRGAAKGPKAPRKAPDAVWPQTGSAVVELPRASGERRTGRVRAENLPLELGTPTEVDGAAAKTQPQTADGSGRAPAARGKVRTRVIDRETARKAGVDGLLFTVEPLSETGSAEDGKPGTVGARLDYSGFAEAFGGGYGARLTLVELPACVLRTPDKKQCRTGTPVTAVNDTEQQTLTAEAVSLRSGSPTVLAAVAEEESEENGDYKATKLSPSAVWDTNLNTGDFSWSYDMPVPEVPGGMKPNVGLSYSSGAIDGRTGGTNNQSSWVGDGFDLWPGYIERRYKPCSEDDVEHPDGNKPGDQCWGYDNAFITFNGKGGELVPAGKDEWKLKQDDGTKINRLRSTNRGNGDDDGEYWRLTDPEGNRYYFGYHRLPGWVEGKETTDSAWTVPVFGDDSGEPCHAGSFEDSWCRQAWRWNLDYAVDRHGNAVAYYYDQEKNSYGRNLEEKENTRYTRGGTLDRIEYGLKSSSMYGTKALAKVTFTGAQRCLPNDRTDCTSIEDDAFYWYDTPWDLNCAAGADCDRGRVSPSFWTRERLTGVTTQILTGDTYSKVDSWKLDHRWGQADIDYQLLLDSVQHTGHTAEPAVTLPKTTFAYTQLENRLDKTGDGYAPFVKARLSTIADESGGRTDVNYSSPVCDWDALPTPETNTTRCFPQYIGGSGSDDPERQWFNKYVVTSVTDTDRTGGAPDQVTRYEYKGGAAWHFDDDDGLTREKFKTWSQWRGYGHVRVMTGGQGGTAAMKSQEDSYFLRGMDGDRKSASGGAKSVSVALGEGEGDPITDHESAAGFAYKTVAFSAPGGKVLGKSVQRPWHHRTAEKERDWGTVTANLTGTAHVKEWASLDDGEGSEWRITSTSTQHDTVAGRVVQVDDFGDNGTSADNQCTRTTYATNTDKNILALPSRVETVAVKCADEPDRSEDVISDERTAYDGGAYGAAPTRGDATHAASLKQHDGTKATYLESGATYDSYGRRLTTTDLTANVTATGDGAPVRSARDDGRITTTAYSPATGLPSKVTETTPPAKDGDSSTAQTMVTELEPLRGRPSAVFDTNNKRTTLAYDALGRTTKVWLAGRLTGTKPDQEYTYFVNEGEPVAVATRTLGISGSEQIPSYTIYDGFLRERQVQEPGPDGGRLISDIFYDERGQVAKTFAPYYAEGAQRRLLFQPEDAEGVESQTRHSYDGLGRETESRQIAGNGDGGAVLGVTKTLHGGDRTTVIPPEGGTATTTLTDARGRTTELRQHHQRAAGAGYDTTKYAYTPSGDLSKVTDPAGNTWTYDYDQLGRQIRSEDPDKGTVTSTYDDRGQLVSTTDARGTKLVKVYDGLGRQTELREGGATGKLRAKWTFDTISGAQGHLAEATRYVDGEAYTHKVTMYDPYYRPMRTATVIPGAEGELAGTYQEGTSYAANGLVRARSFSAAGNITGKGWNHTYENGTLRPLAVYGSGFRADATFSLTGKPLQFELGGTGGAKKTWVSHTYEWGSQRLATSRVDREEVAGVDQHNTYRYDQAGNVLSVSDVSRDGTDTQCFTYDYLRRLTEAWTQGVKTCADKPAGDEIGGPAPYWHSYTYDKTGNRLTETLHDTGGDSAKDTERSYAYPPAGGPQPHTLTSVSTEGPAGTARDTYGYDATGNTSSRNLAGDTQKLTWDAEGHLAKITEPVEGGEDKVTEYLYDTDGNRLIARTPTETTLYLGDHTEIVLKKGSSKPEATRYIPLGGGNQAVIADDGTCTITVADHHGTGQLAIDTATLELTRRRTLPFGGLRGETPEAWPGTRGFVGGVDETGTTGLVHLGAREYDPALGRFISVDPVMDLAKPQQIHGYTYSSNNPLTWTDPTGLMETCGATTVQCYPGHREKPKKPKGKKKINSAVSGGNPGSPGNSGSSRPWGGRLGTYTPGSGSSRGSGPVIIEANDVDAPRCVYTGNVCNGALAEAANYKGDWADLWDLGKQVVFPDIESWKSCLADHELAGCGWAATDLPWFKVIKGGKVFLKGAKKCHSFLPGTAVLLADGTRKNIEDLEVGDEIVVTDPETGETATREVVATIVTEDDKHFVDLEISTETGSASLVSTATHPFWVESEGKWVEAGDLATGMTFRTPDGATVIVEGLRHYEQRQRTHDLTVDGIHTYYVLAGETPVLVHNSNGSCGVTGLAAKIDVENLSMTKTVENHTWDIAGTRDVDAPNFGKAARPYMNGNNGQLLRGIMEGSAPRMDSRGAPGVVEWRTPGTMNGSNGIWELNIDANSNRIVHFLFKSTKG
ncbi:MULTISPECIES: polymorphic toxin-type HINT domain-containing protein [Streptomyces]